MLTSFPAAITSLPLTTFAVSENKEMKGSFTEFFYSCPTLSALEVASTQLSGSLPSNIGSLVPNLSFLDISESLATGSIPASITSLSNMTALTIGQLASFEVVIPEDIGRLGNLGKYHLLC